MDINQNHVKAGRLGVIPLRYVEAEKEGPDGQFGRRASEVLETSKSSRSRSGEASHFKRMRNHGQQSSLHPVVGAAWWPTAQGSSRFWSATYPHFSAILPFDEEHHGD